MEKKNNFKKYISRALKIAVLVVGVVFVYRKLDYYISDDVNARTRVNYHDFYEEEVDTIFLGPSHSIAIINANRLTEDLGESVFNLSSSSQFLTESYAVLEDACENQDIKKVYLEISPSRFCEEAIVEKSVTTIAEYCKSAIIITDYCKSELAKVELITKKFDSNTYIPALFRVRRNLDPLELTTFEDMKELKEKKSEDKYINYEGTRNYLGRGQWAGNDSIAVTDDNTIAIDKNSYILEDFSLDEITDRQEQAFFDIINYCKKHDIQLSFYVTPYCPYYLQEFKNYDSLLNYVREIADENDIPMWDFNLAKEEYLDLPLGYYSNLDHVNMKANSDLMDFLEMCIENPDGDYFYDSLEEKYSDHTDVYAVGYTCTYITEEGEYDNIAEEGQNDQEGAVEGDITNVKIDISPISWGEDVSCLAKLTKLDVEDDDQDNFTYTLSDEIDGTMIDDSVTEFTVKFDHMKTYYMVELVNPDNGETIYKTITNFVMTKD